MAAVLGEFVLVVAGAVFGVLTGGHAPTIVAPPAEPALAQLAAAAVSGLAPAGPDQRQRPPVTLRGEPGVRVTALLCATELGFSLHAATRVDSTDARGREALVRYALRPAHAQARLQLLPSGLVRIALRRPFRDGTVAVGLDALSLLCRLAAAVPPPRLHLVRYAGVLAAASKLRPLVVPSPPAAPDEPPAHNQHAAKPRRPTHRSRYLRWAELLKRTFAIEVEVCPKCSGRMQLISVVTEPSSLTRFLRHLGEPTEAPAMSAARAPPLPDQGELTFISTHPLPDGRVRLVASRLLDGEVHLVADRVGRLDEIQRLAVEVIGVGGSARCGGS